MTNYEPTVYDVVTVKNEENENLQELGIEQGELYVISYLFADGSCVLYKESIVGKALEVYEYIVDADDVQDLKLLYNYMDENVVNYKSDYPDYDDDYDDDYFLDEGIIIEDGEMTREEFENYITQGYSMWVEHPFKVGDLIYFEDVTKVNFYEEVQLKNGELYEITGFNKENNCPLLKVHTDDRFELFPNEVQFVELYEGDIHEEIKNGIDDMLAQLTEQAKQRNFEVAMDEVLAEGNVEKAQEIYNTYFAIH